MPYPHEVIEGCRSVHCATDSKGNGVVNSEECCERSCKDSGFVKSVVSILVKVVVLSAAYVHVKLV